MSNLIWLMGPTAAVLIIAYIVTRRRIDLEDRQPKYDEDSGTFVPPVMSNTPSKRRRVYYGAVLDPGFDCCEPAERLRKERYLPVDAPKLPLPGCDKAKCECAIRPTKDRRSAGWRRGGDIGLYAQEDDVIVTVRKEQRVRKDRREY
ncbi:MAG: hypothetical protein E2O52_03365 [Gammaproteobacteria bacterium]|nr:MAG: hypothetical protein E2O52_03365 [Gammaproteobacteria bacterium]